MTHLVSLFDCGQRRLACVLVLRPVFVILSLAARREEIHADPRSPPSIYIHITHTFTCIRKPQTDRDARLFFTFVILARRGHPIIIFEYIFTHMHVWVEYLIFLFLEFVLDLVLLRLWIAHGDVIARRAQTRLNQTECCVNVKELRQVAFGQRLG